jgi:uncharacterized metal-binding protein
MTEKTTPHCAICGSKKRVCMVEEGQGPEFCPTRRKTDIIEESLKEYARPEVRAFARAASIQEAECYANRHIQPYVFHPVKTRVQEICEFSHRMGYRKLGIAFCAGLHPEAKALADILRAQGFDAVSVSCKAGGTPKERLGLSEEEKIRIGEFEPMCNPIMQAKILNEAKTDFNILVGLCVGHDSLFFRYSDAMTTVLVAKDRVLGHNPAAALYTTGTYYARLLRKGIDPPETEED